MHSEDYEKSLDCALIGVCTVITSNTVYEHNIYSIVNTSTAASILTDPIAPEKSISQGPVVQNLTKLLANATLKLLS